MPKPDVGPDSGLDKLDKLDRAVVFGCMVATLPYLPGRPQWVSPVFGRDISQADRQYLLDRLTG
jgi:hypothetical protein